MVSATVVEAVDTRTGGERLLVFKEAIIAAVYGHPSLLFEKGLSAWSQLKPSQSADLNYLSLVHTRAAMYRTHTHPNVGTCSKQYVSQIICHRLRGDLLKENNIVVNIYFGLQ